MDFLKLTLIILDFRVLTGISLDKGKSGVFQKISNFKLENKIDFQQGIQRRVRIIVIKTTSMQEVLKNTKNRLKITIEETFHTHCKTIAAIFGVHCKPEESNKDRS